MNYLAHFHLAYGSSDLIIGALLGDFVKGPLKGLRHQGIENGIRLHRKIDVFTDRHEIIRQCHQHFQPDFRRYAGIMTDVAFDHFLSKHWNDFHPQSMEDFSAEVFSALRADSNLPDGAQRMAEVLEYHKVFQHYQHWKTVDSALSNIGQRFKADNPMANAAAELHKHYSILEDTFLDFYQDLQKHVKTQRDSF